MENTWLPVKGLDMPTQTVILKYVIRGFYEDLTGWVWSVFNFLLGARSTTYCILQLNFLWSFLSLMLFLFEIHIRNMQLCSSNVYFFHYCPNATKSETAATFLWEVLAISPKCVAVIYLPLRPLTEYSLRPCLSGSTSIFCQALLLNHVISQKHRKNRRVTRQRKALWM